MKKLRQFSVAVVLAFTIAFPVLAGDIQIPPVTAPPSPPPSSIVDGGMNTPRATERSGEATAVNPFEEIGLSLLQSVLSLF